MERAIDASVGGRGTAHRSLRHEVVARMTNWDCLFTEWSTRSLTENGVQLPTQFVGTGYFLAVTE